MAAERTPLPVIELRVDGAAAPVTADVNLAIAERPVHLRMTVPNGPTRMADLLPLFHGLANVIVGIAEDGAERQGRHISCRAGCGACCRQIVPISESEAHAVKRLVDDLPEPRRTAVRQRFADGVRRMAEAGMLKRLRRVEGETNAVALGLDYFRVGVPCPFLEEESCSIHPDRPLACREYLVTSPAENCANPSPETVRCVPMPADVSRAVRAVDRGSSPVGWVPLLLALDWAATHPEPPAMLTGPAALQQVFERLVGRPLPAAS